jgi:hypothetical protein
VLIHRQSNVLLLPILGAMDGNGERLTLKSYLGKSLGTVPDEDLLSLEQPKQYVALPMQCSAQCGKFCIREARDGAASNSFFLPI